MGRWFREKKSPRLREGAGGGEEKHSGKGGPLN